MATINSGNIYQTPNAAGSILYPGQPTFCAYLTSQLTDVTGDGTVYGPVVFGSELFDLNSDYNTGTGNFVAPVSGRYLFTTSLDMRQLGAAHTIILVQIVTSNRTYNVLDTNSAIRDTANNIIRMGGHIFADMDASDTAYVQLTVSNSTKTVDIFGDASGAVFSHFSGTLLS